MNQYIAGDLGDYRKIWERHLSIILGLDDEYCENWILISLKKEIEYYFREEIKREYIMISDNYDGYSVICRHPDIQRKKKIGILPKYYNAVISVKLPKFTKRTNIYYPSEIAYCSYCPQNIHHFEYRLKCIQIATKISKYLECCMESLIVRGS